jgi:hypothetical protein
MNSDATTDQILSRLCEVLNDGMGRFEARARGDKTTSYAIIIEKHRDAVDQIILSKDAYARKNHRARMRKEGKI